VDDDKVDSSSCVKGRDVINQSEVLKKRPTTAAAAARLAVILRDTQQNQTGVIRVSAESKVFLANS
jgi:hypothetical protein